MRRWRNGAAVVLATVALAGVGCAGGGQSVDSGSGAEPGPAGSARVLGASTPPESAPAPSGAMRHTLLEAAEVRPFPAFGFDLRQVPLVDPGKWDVTALTGACGAPLRTPFVPGDDTRLFFSTVALLVQATAPWDDRAQTFFAEAQADLRVGCGGFDDPSAFGAPVALTSAIDLDGLGTGGIGWTQAIAGEARAGLRQVALVHDGERLTMLAVITSPPAPAEHFEQLAAVAFAADGAGSPGGGSSGGT